LTNHFYSVAAPLPIGREPYPLLVEQADVVGFDLYPLQEWCNASALHDVYQAQRELTQLAAGKPTFQWIETRVMKCPAPAVDVTPATVRAETWLASAGGAHGIGYFPNDWLRPVDAEIARTNGEIDELEPVLLAPSTEATSDNAAVEVGARDYNG